jgi:hypothetical protein
MFFRNDQEMYSRLGVNVPDDDAIFILEKNVGADIATANSAEDAIRFISHVSGTALFG